MQLIRNREHAQLIDDLLRAVPTSRIFITDYGLHSLINIAHRHKQLDPLLGFIDRSGFGVTVGVVEVPPEKLRRVIDVIAVLKLDVDDAYQYVAAELNQLKLVSLDADLDRTPNGRLTPEAALKLFKEEPKA